MAKVQAYRRRTLAGAAGAGPMPYISGCPLDKEPYPFTIREPANE